MNRTSIGLPRALAGFLAGTAFVLAIYSFLMWPAWQPVLIIGGFTSVPGAIVGGLIVGAGEKLAEAYIGSLPGIGGGIEYWFAYVLALAVLLVRPQGLFGERIIERI